jgi:hypothetical protein
MLFLSLNDALDTTADEARLRKADPVRLLPCS